MSWLGAIVKVEANSLDSGASGAELIEVSRLAAMDREASCG